MPARLALYTLLLVAAVSGGVLLTARSPVVGAAVGPVQAEAAALRWVGTGVAEAPRRDGGEWEVDVVRPDGSLVEVTVGARVELLGLDEEAGPGGGVAPDDLSGPLRDRAVRSALRATEGGRVLGVERDPEHEIEVDVVRPDGVRVEVGLDAALRIIEVTREDPADE